MRYITDAVLDRAIALANARCDSHEIIRHIQQRFPREYTDQLAHYGRGRSADPIRTLHQQIGRRLRMRPQIWRTARVRSPNVRNVTPTSNQGWRK